MRILFISKDTSLFDENSPSINTLIDASNHLEQIHVVVITRKDAGYETRRIGENVFIHPTNSRSRWFQAYDAFTTAELQTVISFKLVVDVIEADGPFETGFAAYLLSRKYKKKFLIKVSRSIDASLENSGHLTTWFKRKLSQFVLDKANGIRVPTHIIGEVICAHKPNLENKIYIMPPPLEATANTVIEETWDIRTAYSQFNVIILAVMDSLSKNDFQTLFNIMTGIVFNYRRAGLIIIDRGSSTVKFNSVEIPFIIVENNVDDLAPYYRGAHIFLDISTQSKDGDAMIEAALYGCPIVSAPNPSANYIVKDNQNGFIVNPDNPNEVISKIREIIETPGLKESIRLFRHQTEEIFTKTREEYWPTMKEIWRIVSENKTDIPDNEIEEYASSFVYTLRRARKYMKDATKTVEGFEHNLKDRIHMHGKINKKTPLADTINITKEETFNVDKVLGRKK